MLKQNKKTLIMTSVLILLPIAAGLLLWSRLPAQLPTHWNMAGEVDGYSGKVFAVFGLPLLLLAIQWACFLGTSMDPKRDNISKKVLTLVLWIVPAVSLVCSFTSYAAALGAGVNVPRVTAILIGVLFLALGNYLPKCRRSYTVGYKLPWTLESDENWSKTHRLAGKLVTLGGLLVLVSVFPGGMWLGIALVAALVLALAPTVYSYLIFRKEKP